MPSSMTGMGKAVKRSRGVTVEVETKTVNNRYLVIRNHMPDSLLNLEKRVHEIIRSRVKRGTVDLFVKIKAEERRLLSRINKEILESYMKTVQRLKKGVKTSSGPSPELLLGLPGVIEIQDNVKLPKETRTLVEEAARAAVEKMCAMRVSEGGRLLRVIVKRLRLVEKLVLGIEERGRRNVVDRTRKLKARIEEILEGEKLSADDPGLLREIAFLTDRSDVSEEVDRLRSHLAEFHRVVATDGEIGRPLDFLLQEMGREVNTIGSKACQAETSHDVVKVKTELEKIREQVQNIE